MTLDELKKLAGVDIVRHDNVQSLENMSHTAQALKDKERKLGVKPGTNKLRIVELHIQPFRVDKDQSLII